jgi:hypothetical protein
MDGDSKMTAIVLCGFYAMVAIVTVVAIIWG